MIILTETTDTIEIDLDGAVATNQLMVVCSFRDIMTNSYTAGKQTSVTNNTTAVTIVSAPAASTQRVVDLISVYNNDTTNSTVTIQYKESAALRTLFKVTLAAGEKIEYNEGLGWQTFASTGAVKQSINQGANAPLSNTLSTVILGSDVINNNAVAKTIQDVTGLSFSVTAGKLYVLNLISFTPQQPRLRVVGGE